MARPITQRELRNVSGEIIRALAAFAGAPAIEADRFRVDVDEVLDQDATPRR